MDKCAICDQVFSEDENPAKLYEKGANTVNLCSEKRGISLRVSPGQFIHEECHCEFIKEQNIKKYKATVASLDHSSLRSSEPTFNFKTDCLFCAQPAKCDKSSKRKVPGVFSVSTKEFQITVEKLCKERNDDWSEKVLSRIIYAQDLIAADAVYHDDCSSNFRTRKDVPKTHLSQEDAKKRKKTGSGRRGDVTRTNAFVKVIEYLIENDDEQITISELVDKMDEYLNDTGYHPYSAVYMKTKVTEHFGDKIIIAMLDGKQNVVTFRTTATSILQEFYAKPRDTDSESDKRKIIETAAKLIKNDIKTSDASNENYPMNLLSIEDAVDFLPQSLQQFLMLLFPGKNDVKVASLGQAIMQATRPRLLLAPLQFGLGIQMHHHFASRFLIDSLHAHGFCCPYSEVKKFERSAATQQNTDLPTNEASFVQYVADNVDHNVRTLDGLGTFHGMGIIATITPEVRASIIVPKVSVTADDIVAVGRINIHYYKAETAGLIPIMYKDLVDMKVSDATSSLDQLWNVSLPLCSPRPAWSGMMQMVQEGNHPGKSAVLFLPMIDMNPSDSSCIYSTMMFICAQAKRYKFTPILTFDQPLWWKAMTIIQQEPPESELKSIVLRLGGLHIQMSFLGSIGHLMAGSGFQELLETIYANNAVSHMLNGKAISRAIHGHLIVYAALYAMLMSLTFSIPVCITQDQEIKQGEASVEVNQDQMLDGDLKEVGILYDSVMSDPSKIEDVCTSEALVRVIHKIAASKVALLNQRTASLWLQYMEMVDILRKFIKAEWTGKWELHLQAVQDMLPYFAASGHNLYAKSAYAYLQMMLDLKDTHPDVYQKFQDGLHVVRRNERYWAGLSSDLVIEQVLMRSVKTTGGLTRGRGMSEIQRLVWLLSMPACADVNRTMQDITGVKYTTSEQHKDSGKARQDRDLQDTRKVLNFLEDRSPFSADPSLHSIATGVTASNAVNVDKAKQVGEKILMSMVGHNAHDISFKRKDQAVTLATDKGVSINGEIVQVDPQLLFQRLIAVKDRFEDKAELFKYELCSHPAALFTNSALPNVANKPELGNAIWNKVDGGKQTGPAGQVQYVVDGGALLHRIPWKRSQTYEDVIDSYAAYVNKNYGKAIIVFDGYDDGPSTKDATHLRRTGGCVGPTVNFTSNMVMKCKKDEFLSNKGNKQRFINLLGAKLNTDGCTIHHAIADADVLIVEIAVESAGTNNTVVIGDDTDLLILLCYHADMSSNDIFFKPEPKQNSKSRRVWNIKQTKLKLGTDVCNNLLFVHAILGCDTTSRVHGIGKGAALKKLCTSPVFKQQAKVFTQSGSSKTDVIKAGERALVCLFNGKEVDCLDSLRYTKFCHKVATSNRRVEAENIPPTSAAVKYHSLRVYHQVQQWKGEADAPLDAKDWGWKEKDVYLLPILTDLPAAPKELLEIIRCGCKAGCATARCTCKKHGLECTSLCSECKGTSCSNAQQPDLEEETTAQDE